MRLPLARALLACCSLLLGAEASRAHEAGVAPPLAAVVLRVGRAVVTVAELEQQLAGVSNVQLRALGATDDEVKRRFVDGVVARQLLLVEGAEARGLAARAAVALRLRRVRAEATLRAVRERVGPADAVSAADVHAFYDENRARFEAPERYHVWRILCARRDEAQEVLDEARKAGTPAAFQALARDHSVDRATYLRGGNLGFLTLDGASNQPGLRVEAAIVRAAAAVRDGDFVPQPVAEGPNFAVVWRRGTVAAAHRSEQEAAAQIRQLIIKQRYERASQELIDALAARSLSQLDEQVLQTYEPAAPGTAFEAAPTRDADR